MNGAAHPTPGSYLTFLARTRPPLTAAILQLRHPFPDHPSALAAFDSYSWLIRMIAHHAGFLAGLTSHRLPPNPTGRALRLLALQFDAVHHKMGDLATVSADSPWATTARWLATAHDVIAVHFGPERQPRTRRLAPSPPMSSVTTPPVLARLPERPPMRHHWSQCAFTKTAPGKISPSAAYGGPR